jgi:processive 1,2-diacylglycerol beta-glucosyltransferase
MILTSSTGGGHDMRAHALKEWSQRQTDWQVTIHQALEATHGMYAFGVGLYNGIQRVLPLAHHAYFQFLERARLHGSADWIMGARRFRETVEDFSPDLVVSTHDQLNHGFFDLVRRQRGPDRVRCVTYCGELWGGYGFSRHWVNPDADAFIAAVGPCREAALRHGMSPEKAHVGGFLLRPAFFRQQETDDPREGFLGEELGLDPAIFTVLLSTGAVGANNHIRLLRAMESRGRPVQAVVLCGKRESSLRAVEEWSASAKHVRLRALPRREDMPRIMRSVDLLVARPGTGTTSEAILCGTPLLFNCIGGVMPQEYITVKFARHHGFAAVMYWPHQLARLLDDVARNPGLLQSLKGNIHKACPTQHPSDILGLLTEIADSRT